MSAPGPDQRSGSESAHSPGGAVSPEVIARSAELARLALAPDELARLAPEVARILASFASLARCPAAPPAADAPSTAPHAREDEPRPSLARESVLAAAPEPVHGFFAVPKTVGGAP